MNGRRGCGRILGAVAALAVLAGPGRGQPAKPVAVVNGEPITMAEVDAILKRVPPSPTPLSEAQKKVMQREAVDFLVNDLVMKQCFRRVFAGKPGLAPNAPPVNKEIADLQAALSKKNLTMAQFLAECGQTEAQLRAEVARKLQWQAFLAAQFTDADLKKYYEHYKPFFDKVLVRASHILIRVAPDAKDVDRQAAKGKLLAIRQEIVGGKIAFADAAKKYSDCTSKKDGGDINFFPQKGAVLESFAEAAFALKVGEVSNVVETENGYHLIKITDRTAGEPTTFEKVRDDVRRICMMERENALLALELKKAKIQVNLP